MEVLTGSTPAVVTAGAFARVGRLPLVLALLAALPGTMLMDPLYWWAGRLWGPQAIGLLLGRRRRASQVAARVERLGHRFGWLAVVTAYYLPVPTALIYAVAGFTGMRFAVFFVLDLIGTLAWVGLLVGLGYALGQSAVDVASAISHYGLLLFVGLTVIIVGAGMRRRRHDGQAGEPAAEPPAEEDDVKE